MAFQVLKSDKVLSFTACVQTVFGAKKAKVNFSPMHLVGYALGWLVLLNLPEEHL